MKFFHRLEPLLRGLFGAGGLVAALFLPALIFGVALALSMALSRKCETDTDVGLFLKVAIPITHRE